MWRARSAREIGWRSRMRLSAIRRLISRAVVRVAMLKSVVLILRMDKADIVRRADNIAPRIFCQEIFLCWLARLEISVAGRALPSYIVVSPVQPKIDC